VIITRDSDEEIAALVPEEGVTKNPVVPCPICGFELVSARWQICLRCGATILSVDITL